jgi:hypothetical protein
MTLRGACAAFEPEPILRAARQQRSLSGAEREIDASRRRFGTTCCRMSDLSSAGQNVNICVGTPGLGRPGNVKGDIIAVDHNLEVRHEPL